MKIEIKYFASIKEWTGLKKEIIEVPEKTTVEELRKIIVKRYNKLDIENNLLVAINGSFVDLKEIIKERDEIAIFPPVSGG
ncbi:molybdopterin converting factor subunit 1 [Candidatus Bathyarchaeota archaeon]|nr:molybdopterin converting factor subunit 1 [Candidatus Bathyarchaeota archaeon]